MTIAAEADERSIRAWEILLASFIGGTFLCLADILFN